LVKGDRVMLFDVIYEGRSALLCERCSIIENIPIITKPVESQIKQAEEPLSVYERMKRMAGMSDEQKPEISLREQRLKELEKHPELEVPVEKIPDLIDYFHWEIMRNRRRRGLVQEKLADQMGVNVRDIERLEKGIIP
jgi:ribosome-binding protein aMBF1 (putative translation factor)